jgi:hypothetical protein
MQTYRLHFIDRWTGSLRSFVDFFAPADDAARQHAASVMGADTVELWRDQAIIHRFPSLSDDVYPLSNQHERPNIV